MKSTNIAIGVIVVVLILLLGAGGYLMLNKNAGNSTKTVSAPTAKPTATGQTTKSLIDLIKMGQNLRCSFKTDVTNGSTDGTVYVSGQNIRTDFNVTTNGKTLQTSMISMGGTNYIWGSGLPTAGGIKMTVALDKISQNQQASNYFNANQKVNYNCSPWNVDSSLFTPPSNVKFTDMTSLLAPQVTGTTGNNPTKINGANPCDQIADTTAKAACENALKQNGQ
jgi:hypothetical protein